MAKILNPALKTLYGVWEKMSREEHPEALRISNELPLAAYAGKTVDQAMEMLLDMEKEDHHGRL